MDTNVAPAAGALTAAPEAARKGHRWFRINLWLHRWSSLVATPFFLVLCVTGAILIFHDEIDHALGVQGAVDLSGAPPVALDRLVDAAVALNPGKTPLFLGLDAEKPDRARVILVPPGVSDFRQGRPALLNRSTAQPIAFVPREQTLTGFVLTLHRNWFLKLPGELFGGVIAFLVLVSLVTGTVVHAPFVKRMVFGMVRHGRGARVVQLDLHNLIGVVVLGWATLVTLSGIFLAVSALLLSLWQATELKQMVGKDVAAPAQFVSLDTVVAAAERARPDRSFRFVFFPGSEFSSPRHFSVAMYGKEHYNERLFEFVIVDGGTGAVAAAQPLPWYLQAVLISGPLHFGDYGGLALKLLWCASTFGALFITGNGAWLWWKRRHRRVAA